MIKGGPADRAEVKQGDAIVAYQDKPVNDPSSLRNGDLSPQWVLR